MRSGESVLDVYAIPTTRGVLTLVCSARNGAPEAPTWCLNGLDSITVAGAKPLKPAADTAYRMRAPAVLKKLDAARVSDRKALRRAKGPVGQQRAATRLYRAHLAAAEMLAPLAPDKTRSGPRRRVAARHRPRVPRAGRRRRTGAASVPGLASVPRSRAPSVCSSGASPPPSEFASGSRSSTSVELAEASPSGRCDLERAAARERAPERDLVGVLEIAAHRAALTPGG